MPWRDGLSGRQIDAAQHVGCHARLLAGPGTGKTRTLTRRVLALVLEHGFEADEIVALTFTRVAAFQLRQEIEAVLEPRDINVPRVSTLHSYSLRQLLRNEERVEALPKPLRIADDWEERHIIQEDLKERLQKDRVREIKDLFDQLSADWETLDRDDPQWENLFPDPAFIGAWREHRGMFGYTLRSELVYQLRRALNVYPDLHLEPEVRHVLVDEYQDLNACDLEVIRELSRRGCEIYAVGDDDQSIYGFRYAAPQGIRRFTEEYRPCQDLRLETCYRCDHAILRNAEFVANLDNDRLPKGTRARPGAAEGEVRLLRFSNQQHEAQSIARLCQHLIRAHDVDPDEILILLRSDHNQALSSVLHQALDRMDDVEAAEYTDRSPLDVEEGRRALAVLRLLAEERDDLAWRTVLQLTEGIGSASLKAAKVWARENGVRFAAALQAIQREPERVERVGGGIAEAVTTYERMLGELPRGVASLQELVERVVQEVVKEERQREAILSFVTAVAEEIDASSLDDLLAGLSTSLDAGEQELREGAVNILTMHKAKGLSADVVFIVGAEDEFVPGRNEGAREDDERRLLFVSMSRARHRLFITYCRERTKHQSFLGRESGTSERTLTRFLRDAPIRAEDGSRYVLNSIRDAE